MNLVNKPDIWLHVNVVGNILYVLCIDGISMKYKYGVMDKAIKLDVNESDLVRDIKLKIQSQEGIPTQSQLLKFEGIELKDNRILVSYYKILDHSMLDLEG